MAILFSGGYSLIPLGGQDGKKPTVRFRGRKRLPLAVVVDRMAASGSTTYGIRLDGLLVVDVDTDTPEARAYVEERFGRCDYSTKTARGFHLFFRHIGERPTRVRQPNIAIDFKTGPNEFVVGPISERPDGTVYWATGHLPPAEHLPIFTDRQALTGALQPIRSVARGNRHETLKQQAIQFARHAQTREELGAWLRQFRDAALEAPEEFTDSTICKIVDWYWEKRETGRLYGGQNSTANIPRIAIHRLARQGESLSLMLYSVLYAAHGHLAGKTFAIVPDQMRAHGLIMAGRGQLYSAIKVLMETQLIVRVSKATRRREPDLYRLSTMQEIEKTEERSLLTLVFSANTQQALSLQSNGEAA